MSRLKAARLHDSDRGPMTVRRGALKFRLIPSNIGFFPTLVDVQHMDHQSAQNLHIPFKELNISMTIQLEKFTYFSDGKHFDNCEVSARARVYTCVSVCMCCVCACACARVFTCVAYVCLYMRIIIYMLLL